ncbi:signal peptidase II [Gracilibacillus halotolerans]|uniref:Lipoprotein signal peptidase n=1 Tax=Gracilibacillus halotolerans TaxID=74386 RepID=A0A841RMH4_9BACI|nr:signal peptidase II [Gracilibacillus halotolerans]MBB6513991.1 signal peptidase II [Gracilibacillus halotolerans]
MESVIFILFYLITVIIIIVDQISKYWIRATLKVRGKKVIWPGVLKLNHYQNSGAAFGIFKGYGRLFVPLAILILFVCIYILETGEVSGRLIEIGMGLFVGGAIGNAIDRTLFNQVTDFIQFHFIKGIFNIADYAIIFGMLLILLDSIIIGF